MEIPYFDHYHGAICYPQPRKCCQGKAATACKRHGRSMEEEVREILSGAVHEEDVPVGGLGTEIAALFSKQGLLSEISELRGYKINPAAFEP